MDQDSYEKSYEKLLNSMVKMINVLVREGYTKGQIIDYMKEKLKFASKSKEVITMLNDIVNTLADNIISLNAKNSLQPEIKKICQQMEDEKNLSYIGKDGRNYYSREELERADQSYMDQIYTESKHKTI